MYSTTVRQPMIGTTHMHQYKSRHDQILCVNTEVVDTKCLMIEQFWWAWEVKYPICLSFSGLWPDLVAEYSCLAKTAAIIVELTTCFGNNIINESVKKEYSELVVKLRS